MGRFAKKKANEITIARGRLKGALQEVVENASEEDAASGGEEEKKQQKRLKRSRGRPPKAVLKSSESTKSNTPTLPSSTPPPTTSSTAPAAQTNTKTSSSNNNNNKKQSVASASSSVSSTKSATDQNQSKPVASGIHESFVMKLFDRSLDLAKYDENTPLYPICRAWMANQPRSNNIPNFRNRPSPPRQFRPKQDNDVIKQILNGTIIDIHSLPPPKSLEVPRVPSPTPEQKMTAKDDIDINYDIDSPPVKRDDLLDEHKKRWSKIREKWNAHSKAYQQKYILTHEILEAIYKPT